MRLSFILLFASIATGAQCQDTLLAVYGSVNDILSGQPLRSIYVTAYDPADSTYQVKALTGTDGRFMLGLFEERDHRIEFSAEGYAPKWVEVRMEGPTPAQWKEGYGLSLDVSLFQKTPGLDLSMDGAPIGLGIYDPARNIFQWDKAHTVSMRDRQKHLLRAYKQRRSGR